MNKPLLCSSTRVITIALSLALFSLLYSSKPFVGLQNYSLVFKTIHAGEYAKQKCRIVIVQPFCVTNYKGGHFPLHILSVLM